MGVATRASDMRRSKWSSFRGENQAEDYLTILQRNIDERPASRYEVDETVLVPSLGIRGITDRYYLNGSGYHYTFYTRNGLYTFKEKDLLAHGDGLLLQDVMRTIRAGG
jgi:hypothetical protein